MKSEKLSTKYISCCKGHQLAKKKQQQQRRVQANQNGIDCENDSQSGNDNDDSTTSTSGASSEETEVEENEIKHQCHIGANDMNETVDKNDEEISVAQEMYKLMAKSWLVIRSSKVQNSRNVHVAVNNNNNNSEDEKSSNTNNNLQVRQYNDEDIEYELQLQIMIKNQYPKIYELWQYNPKGTLALLEATKAVTYKRGLIEVNINIRQ